MNTGRQGCHHTELLLSAPRRQLCWTWNKTRAPKTRAVAEQVSWGLLSPSTHRPTSCCVSETEMLSPGLGITAFSLGIHKGVVLHMEAGRHP